MIEVEIRGQLTDEEADRLTALLERNGELIEEQDRTMILLHGYPGYSKDPVARETDIRLRDTNGSCEIMVKHKGGDHNVARHELSLPIKGNLEAAKQVLKALGFSQGLWMHRPKKVYMYKNIEWSIIRLPHGLCYYEAEQITNDSENTERIHEHLKETAQSLGLSVLNPEEMRDFIYKLDEIVNKEISW